MFWTAGEEIVWISSVFAGSGPEDVGYSFVEAMVAPMAGVPRRPAKVVVESDAMADALRAPLPDSDQDVRSLVEIAVGPVEKISAQVTAFLESHAEALSAAPSAIRRT